VSDAPILRVENLQARFRTRHFGVSREVPAVDDITFSVGRNEIFGLAGESSSGKTTLIKTIAGLIRPPLELVGGKAEFAFLPGAPTLHQAPAEAVARIRWRNLSYIMQGSMNVLNPLRRIGATFRDFALPHLGGGRAEFEARVTEHLARLRLEASVLEAYPHEPTTALDVIVQKDVLGMIRSIQREMGSSVLFVTHDMAVHATLTDRLGVMYAGCLVEVGATRDLFARPRHPYTRHLIQSLPRIGDDRPRTGLTGSPPNLADPPPGCRFHPRCPLAVERCRTTRPAMLETAPGHRVACHAVEEGRS
jgi:peptide/nickel transport system ATP-binding protein